MLRQQGAALSVPAMRDRELPRVCRRDAPPALKIKTAQEKVRALIARQGRCSRSWR